MNVIAKPKPQDLLPHAVEKVAQVSAQRGDVVNVKCPLTPRGINVKARRLSVYL